MILYYNWKTNTKEPVTVQEIKRILSEAKIIDIFKKEEFPSGKVTFVGLSNNSFECMSLWDMKYSDHGQHTYGGYFSEEHIGSHLWWTMNHCYNENFDHSKAYIVSNEIDGGKLAAFLNFCNGLNNIEKTIFDKEDEIKKLKEDLIYLEEAKETIKELNI